IVFFVISGFLITSLLLSEYVCYGSISLKLFYARRSLRIFPPCYAYVFTVAALSAIGVIRLGAHDLVAAFTYTVNYLPGRVWEIGHLWSLSVEEQFYLIWALVFAALGAKRAHWAAVGMVLMAPLARIANQRMLIGTPFYDLEMFPMVADSIAMGCLLAMSRKWLEQQGWYVRLFKWHNALFLLGLVLAINRYSQYRYAIVDVFGPTLRAAYIAVLIHRTVYDPNTWTGRLFNWPP